jgi:hypothetical protein
MKHTYETTFQISRKEVLVVAEFTAVGGCPAHMGSMSYEGHPAEDPEIEFTKIEIKASEQDGWVEAPKWIYDIFQNDEDVFSECIEAASSRDDGYLEYDETF